MNASDAFMADAAAKSLDTAQGTTPGNSTIKCSVVGVIADDEPLQTHDQATFFIYPLVFSAIASGYIEATITPAKTRFTNARLGQWLALNPMPLRLIKIDGATDADVLSSMEVLPKRVTPQGQSAEDTIDISTYQTAQDFRDNRVQVPIAIVLDGATYLDIVNECDASAAFEYTIAFVFGPVLDRRLDVPEAGPVTFKSPGR